MSRTHLFKILHLPLDRVDGRRPRLLRGRRFIDIVGRDLDEFGVRREDAASLLLRARPGRRGFGGVPLGRRVFAFGNGNCGMARGTGVVVDMGLSAAMPRR